MYIIQLNEISPPSHKISAPWVLRRGFMSLYTVNRYFLKYLIARKIIPLLEVIEYFLKEPVGVKISDDEISTEINYATYSKIKLIHISENKKKTSSNH